MSASALVVVSGLPGTGKSTLAAGLARTLPAALLGRDVVEATLWREGIGRDLDSGTVAYEVLTALAGEQLRLGRPAVLDAVTSYEGRRDVWRALAQEHGAPFRAIECVCSDEALHRGRLEGRVRAIPGWYEVDWAQVEDVRAHFEPWTGERLVLDAVDSFDANLARALEYVRR